MMDLTLLTQNAVPIIICIAIVIGSIVCLMQKDSLRMAVMTSFEGFALAALFQVLLAPDVALTQAVVGAAIVPTLVALTIKKTNDEPISKEGDS